MVCVQSGVKVPLWWLFSWREILALFNFAPRPLPLFPTFQFKLNPCHHGIAHDLSVNIHIYINIYVYIWKSEDKMLGLKRKEKSGADPLLIRLRIYILAKRWGRRWKGRKRKGPRSDRLLIYIYIYYCSIYTLSISGISLSPLRAPDSGLGTLVLN